MEKLLKGKEVADRLSISRSQAYVLMRSNQIPTIKIGKSVRVSCDDLEKFILSRRVINENRYGCLDERPD